MTATASAGVSGYTGREVLDRVLAHPALDYSCSAPALSRAATPTSSTPGFGETGPRLPALVTNAEALASSPDLLFLCLAELEPPARGVGDHASTFGGNPVVCAAACAVCDALTKALLEHVVDIGAVCLDLGFLVTTADERTLRLMPPLVVDEAEVGRALDVRAEALS